VTHIAKRQRMFHGSITAAALADQLAARFGDRQHRTLVEHGPGTALIQIGSKHGTPATVHIADTTGGVLVTLSRDRNWLDRTADAGEIIERAAAGNPISLLAMIPDALGELRQENVTPQIWDAVNEICALSRALAGEEDAPGNPVICEYCQTPNPPGSGRCHACGGALQVDLPRVCPKCGRNHTSDALFCQACGTRLVQG
jgi:hypothetical protein